MIADWATRLCTAPPGPADRAFGQTAGPAEDLLAALDLPADALEPGTPPDGLACLELIERDTLRLTPIDGPPSRADLAALLGPEIDGPDPAGRPSPDHPGHLARFSVAVADAPLTCEVVGCYAKPGGATIEHVVLRRRPVRQARRGR